MASNTIARQYRSRKVPKLYHTPFTIKRAVFHHKNHLRSLKLRSKMCIHDLVDVELARAQYVPVLSMVCKEMTKDIKDSLKRCEVWRAQIMGVLMKWGASPEGEEGIEVRKAWMKKMGKYRIEAWMNKMGKKMIGKKKEEVWPETKVENSHNHDGPEWNSARKKRKIFHR